MEGLRLRAVDCAPRCSPSKERGDGSRRSSRVHALCSREMEQLASGLGFQV